MDKVAEMLGVEFEEEFQVEGRDGVYVLSVNGLSKDHVYKDSMLRLLINGMYKIKRKPWKPKLGDLYYCPSLITINMYVCANWDDGHLDVVRLERGAVFKTKAEAAEAAEKMLKALEV